MLCSVNSHNEYYYKIQIELVGEVLMLVKKGLVDEFVLEYLRSVILHSKCFVEAVYD
jgi:hypothetical protein